MNYCSISNNINKDIAMEKLIQSFVCIPCQALKCPTLKRSINNLYSTQVNISCITCTNHSEIILRYS